MKLLLLIALVQSFTVTVNAVTVGTKFACCISENTYCLNGGGGTIWRRTLADRALTQVDAKLRCGLHRMEWNTHSCPASTPCSEPVPVSPPTHTPTTPPTTPKSEVSTINRTEVYNSLTVDAYVILDSRGEGFSGNTTGWHKVGPGERRTFTHNPNACIGYSVNQQDRISEKIAQKIASNDRYDSTWVHPTLGFETRYWEIINGATVWISLDSGAVKTEISERKGALQQRLRDFGMTLYRCLPVRGISNVVLD